MSADFGRPQGVLASVLAVVALVLGAAGLYFGLSASKMKTEFNDRFASMEDRLNQAGQQAQAAATQVRQLDIQTQRAMITIGTKLSMIDSKLNPPTNAVPVATPGTRPQGPAATGTAVATAEPTAGGTYVIKSGDTLEKIAKKHGTTADGLTKLNPGLDARHLKVGAKIKVPAAGAAGATTHPKTR